MQEMEEKTNKHVGSLGIKQFTFQHFYSVFDVGLYVSNG